MYNAIGLASFECKNRNVSFNMAQIEKAMRESHGKADLLCFGEAYLQGFDSLCRDYAIDKEMALETNSEAVCQLCKKNSERRALTALI